MRTILLLSYHMDRKTHKTRKHLTKRMKKWCKRSLTFFDEICKPRESYDSKANVFPICIHSHGQKGIVLPVCFSFFLKSGWKVSEKEHIALIDHKGVSLLSSHSEVSFTGSSICFASTFESLGPTMLTFWIFWMKYAKKKLLDNSSDVD